MATWAPSASAASQSITSSGPLTTIEISDTLNCAVNHTGDTEGEFFGDTACGTFLAAGGQIYGPESIPAGSNVTGASNYLAFTPVSQTPVSGTGTATDPFRIVTVVNAGSSGLQLTQTDTYVVGQETYRTDVTISNSSGAAVPVVLYRAGDCFLQDSDTGFGAADPSSGSVSCVGVAEDAGGNSIRSSRIEQWRPLTPGSSYIEALYSDVWAAVATGQPFPNTCRCDELIDNGAGLSWSATIPANGSATFSHLTSFSPAGNQPLAVTKTADAASVPAGGADGYTITVINPNTAPVTVNSITDTLPAGFTYTPGSTTGATTADPTVNGQTLTWAGPFSVPAGGNITLHFNVTASATPGTYTNTVTADAGSFAVAPSGDTAPITVTGAGGTTTTTGATTTTTGGTTTTGATTTTTGATTTVAPTSVAPTTAPPTSVAPTSAPPTSAPPTSAAPTSAAATTVVLTTVGSTTTPSTLAGPTAQANPSTVEAGQQTTIFGSGFPANTALEITMSSDPVVLASTTSNASGSYSVVVTIPAGTAPGAHQILVRGGGVQATTTIMVVTKPVPLHPRVRTGSDPGSALRLAALVFLAGGLLLLLGAGDPAAASARVRGRRRP
jgi:hypothetical protein